MTVGAHTDESTIRGHGRAGRGHVHSRRLWRFVTFGVHDHRPWKVRRDCRGCAIALLKLCQCEDCQVRLFGLTVPMTSDYRMRMHGAPQP